MPILKVKDVEASARFYVDGLGFNLAGTWQSEDGIPNFAIVVLDHITIGLTFSEAINSDVSWSAYLYVEDIEVYSDQISGNGVKISRLLVEQPYGCKDFEIEDPDGNILCFGQDLSPGADGPGL